MTTNEDTAYTFAAADFGFTDPIDAPTALSGGGIDTLALPAAARSRLDGVAVTAGDVDRASPTSSPATWSSRPAANANGAGYASFTFQVQDTAARPTAASTSTAANTMTSTSPP